MTYRDTKDALRARIEALESRLAQRAHERTELEEELGQARGDLASMEEAEQPPRPKRLLALGVAGTLVSIASVLLLNLLRVLPYSAWTWGLAYGAADACLALGMLGLYRVTRQRLALAAAILLFLALADGLLTGALSAAGYRWGLGYSWIRSAALGVVEGLALIKAGEEVLRAWKRNLAGALCFGATFIGLVSMAYLMIEEDRSLQVVRGISYVAITLYVGKNIALLLCFLELRRPRALSRP